MNNSISQPSLLSLHEVASTLRYHVRTIYRMIGNREIRATRIRNRWMVRADELAQYLEQQKTNLR